MSLSPRHPIDPQSPLRQPLSATRQFIAMLVGSVLVLLVVVGFGSLLLWLEAPHGEVSEVSRRLSRYAQLLVFIPLVLAQLSLLLLEAAASSRARGRASRDTCAHARAKRVLRAPGTRLLRIAEVLAPKRLYEGVFEPVVADMQQEYFDALFEQKHAKARMVIVRGYWAFGRATFESLFSVADTIRRLAILAGILPPSSEARKQ